MGDPRRLSKKYKRPKKLWDKARIQEESALKREYGLKNTREVWIARAELRKVRREARRSLALPPEEREAVISKVLKKLARLNILGENATVDDILSLTTRDILERRLQTQVFRKGLAKTIKQARQLIVHGFIAVNGVRVTSPGFLVPKNMEEKISYYKDASNVFKQPIAEVKEEQASEGAEGAEAEEAKQEMVQQKQEAERAEQKEKGGEA